MCTNLSKTFRHLCFLFAGCLLWGCSSDGSEVIGPIEEEDPDEVTVLFTAGRSATVTTRTALPENTPVKVYVYRRSSTSTATDFTAAPYKVVEGTTGGTGTGLTDLSTVTLNGGDITNGQLTVRGGFKYDFVAVVNATPKAKITDFGAYGSGALTGFTHGADILAGRAEGVTPQSGSGTMEVKFTQGGADVNGNLSHVGSAMMTEARVTQDFIDFIKDGSSTLSYAVSGMDFKQCLPKSGTLIFGNSSVGYSVQASGYNTSYSSTIAGETKLVNATTDVALSADAVILPYPLRYTDRAYNTLDIDFRLNVNGGNVTFSAVGVQVPPFIPGYRYRFIIELEKDPDVPIGQVNLALSVEDWGSTSWQSSMGEGATENKGYFTLGSWSSVSWQSGMGAGHTSNLIIASVAGWSGVSWASHMGND